MLTEAFDNLVGMAEIAQVMEYLEPAARILGADDAYRMVYGSGGLGGTPMLRKQTKDLLITLLGDARFTLAWTAGRALATDDAIDEALALADMLSGAQR